jgi:hypothetical protein
MSTNRLPRRGCGAELLQPLRLLGDEPDVAREAEVAALCPEGAHPAVAVAVVDVLGDEPVGESGVDAWVRGVRAGEFDDLTT